jgi:uncharacterized protein
MIVFTYMNKQTLEKIKKIFSTYPDILLAYFFGSQATGDAGPLSDYDFAIYLDSKEAEKAYDIKFKLMDELGRLLKTDNIDVVILDLTDQPELKYNIIKDGILLLEVKPHKVLLEPRVLNEFFDFRMSLEKNGLSRPTNT